MNNRRIWWVGSLSLLLVITGTITTAVQLENRDSFCASCHTEPETTYYSRSLESPSDLASSHQQGDTAIRCIDCHSGAGMNGRLLSLKQGALDLAAYLSGTYHQPAITTNPLGDQGCTKCHADPDTDLSLFNSSRVSTSRSHYHLNAYLDEWETRAPNPAGTCASCHTGHTQDDEDLLFMNFESGKARCEDCHVALSGWIPPKP